VQYKAVTMASERMKIIFQHLHGKGAAYTPVSFDRTGSEFRNKQYFHH
jgi:hypothetical protein